MEIMNQVAKQQQTQMNPTPVQNVQPKTSQVEQIQQQQQVQEQKSNEQEVTKIDSEKEVEDLVKDLNTALNPFNTSLRFGFDNTSEDFYVSVIETASNRIIRRFPAEQAVSLAQKMQDMSGFLFDQKG
ncbi:MAG: flagellar protein FlaG [Campylobacterota bacterium]|nr:flagellar protein FlaG [Campylobacterota bacterium]